MSQPSLQMSSSRSFSHVLSAACVWQRIVLGCAATLFACGCSPSPVGMSVTPAGAATSSTAEAADSSSDVTPDASSASIGAGTSEYYVYTEQGGIHIDTVQGYMAFMVPTPSTNIQVVFGNAYQKSETPGPTMTISASIENPIDSTPVQLTFGGKTSASLAGGSVLTSDAYTGSTTAAHQLIYIRYIASKPVTDDTVFPANWIFKAFAGDTILAPYTTTKPNGRFDGVEELMTRTVTDADITGKNVESASAGFKPQDAGQSVTIGTAKYIIASYVDADNVTLTTTPTTQGSKVTLTIAPENKTLSGTIYNGAYTEAYGPYALLATPISGTAKPAALVGDSITYGLGDDNTKGGWATRALDIAGSKAGLGTRVHTTLPYVQASMPGDTICNLINYNKLRFSQLGKTKNVLGLMGTNDIPGGNALKIEGCFITLMQQERAAGPAPWYGTVIPHTSSTDYWATTGNQTPTSTETTRVAFNTWLRDGAPIDPTTKAPVPVGTSPAIRAAFYSSTGTVVHAASGGTHPAQGIFELADTVETSQNSGIWTTPSGNITITGATLNKTTTVTTTSKECSKNLVGLTTWLSDQQSALGTVKSCTDNANGTSTIVLSAAAPIDRTDAELTFSKATTSRANTADGTHPSDLGAPIMAAAGAAIITNWTY